MVIIHDLRKMLVYASTECFSNVRDGAHVTYNRTKIFSQKQFRFVKTMHLTFVTPNNLIEGGLQVNVKQIIDTCWQEPRGAFAKPSTFPRM